jgi:hypothetical protein
MMRTYLFLATILSATLCSNAYAEDSKAKETAKEVGQAAGAAAREVGQDAKKVGKEIGKAVTEAARETGHAFRDGAKEFKKAVKGDEDAKKTKDKCFTRPVYRATHVT